jgi:hypothetical protein
LTVNVGAPVVGVIPIGVVAVTFLGVGKAPFVIAQLALIVVEVDVILVQVTPPPAATAVAPLRLVPVRVIETVVLCDPDVGLMEVSVGPCTVNGTALLAVPFALVTVKLCDPTVAPAVMVKVAAIVVEFCTVTPLTVTPLPAAATVVPVAVKLSPLMVTGTFVPRTPVLGVIKVSVAVGGLTTVNDTVLLVPPGAVTDTFLADSPALAVMVKFAVTVVSFTTVKPLTVTPPDTLIAVVEVSPVPVRVTGRLPLPRAPAVGAIEASTGPATVNVTELLVPPGLVTVTFLGPIVVVALLANAAVIVVGLTTETLLTVMPVIVPIVVPVAVKLVPVKVTGTDLPRRPELGTIEARVGADGLTTVNAPVRLDVVPLATVATKTYLTLSAAPAAIVKFAVT